MRRRFWPYAMLAVVISLLGLAAMGWLFADVGPDRAGAQLTAANASVVEPVVLYVFSLIGMVVPFDLPDWFKNLYAILVLVALVGLGLSTVVGLLLLPVFYALYRRSSP